MAQKDLTLAGSQPIEVGLAAPALGMAAPTPTLSAGRLVLSDHVPLMVSLREA